jgi:glycosyltransferase involved in cell wall biosynthesis
MNILLISRCPPLPLYLGDRLIVYHLARELAARGHTLDLLAFDDRPDLSWRLADAPYFRRVHIMPAPERTAASVVQRWLFPAARFPRTASASASPGFWKAARNWIADGDYDIAHLFGGVQVYEFRHAVEPLPALITPYESYTLYLKSESRWGIVGWGQRLFARAYERFMFTPYARTTVVSERDAEMLRSLQPRLKVEVIPNGVDLSYFNPAAVRSAPIDPSSPSLVFVGNYEYPPNEDAAIRLARDIFPHVRSAFPRTKLLLVGNAPTARMRAAAGEGVFITGRVDDVRAFLKDAWAFVCPLAYGAGIKNKILEALAMGCPVIATPLSIDGIDVREGESVLTAPLDQIADAVIRLLGDADLRSRLSAEGRALIERAYSWQRVVSQYEQLYEALAAPKGADVTVPLGTRSR